MNYGKFAYLYDELMTDAPYEQWVSFVLDVIKKSGNHHRQILDVGCGTGNIAIPLSKNGLQVTAVDLSEEMLFVAKEKNDAAGANVQFFQQDMRELDGLGEYDLVISLCDCINYLNNEQEISGTFQRVANHLKENGLFIFDVHSIHKVNDIFTGKTFAHNGEEISYIWECFAGEEEYSVDHDLSFFVQNEKGLYERYDEFHKQRTYTIETYGQALKKSGFEVISITGDFSLETLDKDAERWFFVTRKL